MKPLYLFNSLTNLKMLSISLRKQPEIGKSFLQFLKHFNYSVKVMYNDKNKVILKEKILPDLRDQVG